LSEIAAGLSEIVLYVVATSSTDSEAALAAAREHLARKLPAFKLPRQYALAAELPRAPPPAKFSATSCAPSCSVHREIEARLPLIFCSVVAQPGSSAPRRGNGTGWGAEGNTHGC
jgi:hypothetical protein